MLQALGSFFAIIDPLGSILVFHLYSQRFGFRQRLTAALIAVVAAFVMLVAFSLGGPQALEFLGISEQSFKVAAGLMLLPSAYGLIMTGEALPRACGQAVDPLDFALVPLATPLIAGPGALAATTSFTGQVGSLNTIAAFTIILLVTLAAFVLADWLFRLLGESLLRLMSRLVGIVLFAIAVEFILDGVRSFFQAT